MSLVKKLKSVLAGDEGMRQYTHQCSDCGSEFESAKHNPNQVSCPECGSERIHTAI